MASKGRTLRSCVVPTPPQPKGPPEEAKRDYQYNTLLHFDDASESKEDKREEAAGESARLWVFEELMDESYAVILDHIRPDIPVPGAALCIIQATDLDSITQRVPQANAGLHFTLPEWD
ncbi:hypothetical protein A7C99_6912 [Trichophyton rubrum]|uniref:Uncharacterized protein n=1 Tax=Trichophyton rubrum TaxID=5551 RepID=A0A178EQJ7_TRIRU|nr:hypothetical protein A7C99_6912 [Trichophyton rubrum]